MQRRVEKSAPMQESASAIAALEVHGLAELTRHQDYDQRSMTGDRIEDMNRRVGADAG